MKRLILGMVIFLAFILTARGIVPERSLIDGIKPGLDGKIDLVAMFPHQDDELNTAGTFILLKKEDPRVRTHIVCFTLGELSSAKERLQISPEFQGRIRAKELETAATVIGADDLIQLQYHDQGLSKLDPEELRKKILEIIEKTEAEVVITYGPDGMSGHPDHITLSKAIADAFPQSKAQRLYYVAVPHFLCPLVKDLNKIGCTIATIKVDIRLAKKLKKLAFYEHATQKMFSAPFPMPDLTFLRDYEYFALADEN